METLVMKRITAIDLVDSDVKANEIVINVPQTAEGAFRRVYVGNYRVLKRAKSVIPKLWIIDESDKTGKRFNLTEADNFKKYEHLGLFAKVEWVSADGRYLVMEKMDMSDHLRIAAVKKVFADLWVDSPDGDWQAAVDCCERLRVLFDHYFNNNKDKTKLDTLMGDSKWDRKVYWKKLETFLDKGIYAKIAQLPFDVAIDLHYNNMGCDMNGNLKIIDFGGC